MLVKLIKYVYYRTSHVYDKKETLQNFWYYKNLIKDQHYAKGGIITALLVKFNVGTVLHILQHNFIIQSDSFSFFENYWCTIVSLLLGYFLSSKESYDKLHEIYKNEKYRVIKGCLIVVYIIMSIVTYILA